MAIALVGSGSAHAGSNADGFTSGEFDTTGADLIIINLGQGNAVSDGVITDSKGNTWTPKNQPSSGGKSTRLVYAWNATAGAGHTFTVSGTDNYPAISISWWSGSQTSSDPFDQQTAGGSVPFSNTVQPGSVTPSTDNQLVITGLSGDASSTLPTINLGFTVIGTINNTDAGHQNSALAYEIQTTATARNPTWTTPGTGTWAAAIATFKASAGGGNDRTGTIQGRVGTGAQSVDVKAISATSAGRVGTHGSATIGEVATAVGSVGLRARTFGRANDIQWPLKVSANDRYLVDQNETPARMVVECMWSMLTTATLAQVETYLNDRIEKGFTAVQISLIDRLANATSVNQNGDTPFTGAIFTTPREAYFSFADDVIEMCAQKGFTVILAPLYLGFTCSSGGWCGDVQAASTADLESWGDYVGTRYADFTNLIWLVGGDADPNLTSGVAAKVDAFADALVAADPNHLVTFHNGRGKTALDAYPSASWLTLNTTYALPVDIVSENNGAYAVSPTLPFYMVEGWFENEHGITAATLRAQSYWTIMSGGCGALFGNCPLWAFDDEDFPGCNEPDITGDWQVQLQSDGSFGQKYFHQFLEATSWWALEPDPTHTFVTSGRGTLGTITYCTAASTADGTLGVAYIPTNRTITVDMTVMANEITARWYDPTNGLYTTIGTFPNTGTEDFTPSATNAGGDADWVLILEAESGAQIAHPNADVSDGGWTNELGSTTNLYASVDEVTASSADYIQSSVRPSNDPVRLGFPSLSTPVAGQRWLRYRYMKDRAYAARLDLTVELLEGGTVVQTWNHNDISATETLAEQEITATISDYSDLDVRFTANEVP